MRIKQASTCFKWSKPESKPFDCVSGYRKVDQWHRRANRSESKGDHLWSLYWRRKARLADSWMMRGLHPDQLTAEINRRLVAIMLAKLTPDMYRAARRSGEAHPAIQRAKATALDYLDALDSLLDYRLRA